MKLRLSALMIALLAALVGYHYSAAQVRREGACPVSRCVVSRAIVGPLGFVDAPLCRQVSAS